MILWSRKQAQNITVLNKNETTHDKILNSRTHKNNTHLNEDLDNKEYFLPHDLLINSHSTATKIRVVFDVSA